MSTTIVLRHRSCKDWKSYAHQYGVTAVVRCFSRVLKCRVTEITVHSICNVNREDLKLQRWCGITEPIWTLPGRPRGRLLLLGTDLDKKLQLYVKKAREGSAVVSSKVVVAAARGILKAYDRQRCCICKYDCVRMRRGMVVIK